MNTNCLLDCKCPQCGQVDTFKVEAKTLVTLIDSGTDEYGDMIYDAESYACCPVCDWEGAWGEVFIE